MEPTDKSEIRQWKLIILNRTVFNVNVFLVLDLPQNGEESVY